jgi:hypothetical protein
MMRSNTATVSANVSASSALVADKTLYPASVSIAEFSPVFGYRRQQQELPCQQFPGP